MAASPVGVQSRSHLSLAALTLALAVVFGSSSAADDGAQAVQDCVQGNYPASSALQHIQVSSVDRSGGTRTLEARVHWKRIGGRPRAMIRVDAPTDVKGAAYLMIADPDNEQVYVYMPKMKKVRRITTTTASNQLWGTDFSFEDMKHLQGAAGTGTLARLPNGELAGRVTHVVEMHLDETQESAYQRVVSHVDAESCVALRVEFYEQGPEPRKVLDADPASLTQDGERWIATRYSMRDVKNETETELVVARSEMDADLPDHLFSPSRLDKGR